MYQNTIRKFNNISFIIITGLCALLPFFFLPATLSGQGATKEVLLYVSVFLAASLWLVAQFLEGSFKIQKNQVFLALGAWLALSLISGLLSPVPDVSLWGRGFAVDSFATVLVIVLFTFMVASFARDQRRLVQLFLAAFAGSVLTIFLQVILYVSQRSHFVSTYLAHVTTQGTLIGSWVDFAYFVIFTFLLGLLMYEVLMPKGFFKILSLIAMILSLLVLVFLNFKTAWVITIVSALLVFVYKSSVERSLSKFFTKHETKDNGSDANEDQESASRFPLMSFIALLVGLFFFLSSNSIGATLAHYAGISFSDIRPSFGTTNQVMRATLAHHPLFGAGAGRYADMWNLYHPLAINSSPFWNTAFDTGYSFLQSLFTTNGILPTLALIFVLVMSLIHGFKLFSYKFPDRFSRFIAVTAAIMLVAFTCLFAFASPGIVLIIFGFMYLGLLLGVSTLVGRTRTVSYNYLKDPRTSFFAILLIVLATMAGFSAVYFSADRFVSIVYYNRAIEAGNVGAAQARLNEAMALSSNDVYWKTETQLLTNQFTSLESAQSPDKSQLQSVFSQAQQSAQAAVSWDQDNAGNWLLLSQVYQLIANSQNPDAYANAKTAADQALKLSPNNPVFLLNEAQLALTKQDTAGALNYVAQAIALKQDYLDAYVLKAQIEIAGGNANAGVTEMTAYTQAAPFDDQGFILLGQAELQLKDYPDAIAAFAQAKSLAPTNPNDALQYINALEVSGDKPEAIVALQAFKSEFPQVTGVDAEIQRLQNTPAAPAATAPASSSVKVTAPTVKKKQ